MSVKKKLAASCGVIIGLSFLTPTASADWLAFENISHNDPADAAIGETQFGLHITENAPGQVLFEYVNQGPEPCTLTEIYLEKGTPLILDSIWNQASIVEFTAGPKPKDLPGGKALSPKFQADKLLSAGANSPSPHLGVNPGESISMLYDLNPGTSYESLLQQVQDQSLRVGIHVQGFESGGSESYIATIPEPGTLLLILIGACCLLKKPKFAR
jgi:hypothetical protein